MENEIEFTKKPMHGVFSEAAKRMGIIGDNARVLARNYFESGNRKAVSVVSEIIKERTEEAKKSRAILDEAASFQNSNSGGQ